VPEPAARGFASFAEKLGLPGAAKKLAFEYGGGQITLPVRLAARNDEIVELRRSGAMTAADIARQVGVTERYVYRVLADARNGGE
jgi:Helix-turn-helix domain of resolvase